MTESCHFNDKNSLGGSFCIWKGGSIMATTRIMPLHVGNRYEYAFCGYAYILEYVSGYCSIFAGDKFGTTLF